MIDNQTKFVADNFIRSLQAMPEVIDYLDALSAYENAEINSLTEKYYSLSSKFQKKQYDGTLTQEEINELREIAAKIQTNPLNINLAEKQNALKIFCKNVMQLSAMKFQWILQNLLRQYQNAAVSSIFTKKRRVDEKKNFNLMHW